MIRGRRIESPSSINTFKQCQRKYYYQYVLKLPTTTSIHLIRGSIVHKVLENFYDIDINDPQTQNFKFLHLRVLSLFSKEWKKNSFELEKLGLNEEKLLFYYDESVMMIQNWFNRLKKKIELKIKDGKSFQEAFNALTPKREALFESEKFQVRGYIDLIHELDGKIIILDYKTSKNAHITDAYRLQLAIYAMLYEEKHGVKPDLVGIDFLKDTEHILPVDNEMIKFAQFEIEQVHAQTTNSKEEEFKKNVTPLCKWRTGQCDFYDVCFGGVSIEEFRKAKKKQLKK